MSNRSDRICITRRYIYPTMSTPALVPRRGRVASLPYGDRATEPQSFCDKRRVVSVGLSIFLLG